MTAFDGDHDAGGAAAFEHAPVPMFVQDFSAVRQRLDELRAVTADDLRGYLAAHPDEVARLAALVKIVDLNHEAVRFFARRSKEELSRGLPPDIDESWSPGFSRTRRGFRTRGSLGRTTRFPSGQPMGRTSIWG